MGNDHDLPFIRPAGTPRLGRREMLRTLVGTAAAGVAIPGLAADHPLRRHLADAPTVEQADTKANARDWKPEFLDRHQFETLQSLAERIVPGSARARGSEFIDQLLAVAAPADQRRFLNALGAFERQAVDRARRPWKALGAAEQDAILTDASTMASGRPEQPPWTAGEPVDRPRAPVAPVRLTLRDHFDLLKGWIAGAYYSSEIGMRELGWTGTVFFDSFPGCDHPDQHK